MCIKDKGHTISPGERLPYLVGVVRNERTYSEVSLVLRVV